VLAAQAHTLMTCLPQAINVCAWSGDDTRLVSDNLVEVARALGLSDADAARVSALRRAWERG
jgi:hypothetical protein